MDALTARRNAHPSGKDAVLTPIDAADAMARDSAGRLRAGLARPLEGIPFGVKDIIDVAGARVTCGSHLTGERIAAADAVVVARLRAQGAIPVAMLATTEYACGSAHNPRYGAVRNPWDCHALDRRILHRVRRGAGGAVVAPCAWHRHRGLDPRALCLVRHHRPEADARAGAAHRGGDVVLDTRSCGSDGAFGRRPDAGHAADRRSGRRRPGLCRRL